jgi:16S rRNA (uracil1498-N3)-methyltransferase
MNALVFREKFPGEIFVFSKDEIQHLKVKRVYDEITKVTLRDGRGKEWLYEKSQTEFHLIHFIENKPTPGLEIYTAFPKAGKWEFYIQKLTELSVSKVNLVYWERSQNFPIPKERIKKIQMEAGIQSNQIFLPEVSVLPDKDSILEDTFFLDPLAETPFDPQILKFKKPIIGPEGGFTENEIQWMKNRNIPSYHLGKQVLRIETAGIYMAVLFHQFNHL